jgi:hypothetical protein
MAASQWGVAQQFEPTAAHKVLQQDVGTWIASGKMWMPGTEDPMEFKGKEVNRLIGGMWIVSDFEGDMFGQPFSGHSTMGYDMESKKYFAQWMDSMSPYAATMSGAYDAEKKTMTMNSVSVDPETGKKVKGKSVVVYKDAKTRLMTMYNENPETPGEMMKSMEIVYTLTK